MASQNSYVQVTQTSEQNISISLQNVRTSNAINNQNSNSLYQGAVLAIVFFALISSMLIMREGQTLILHQQKQELLAYLAESANTHIVQRLLQAPPPPDSDPQLVPIGTRIKDEICADAEVSNGDIVSDSERQTAQSALDMQANSRENFMKKLIYKKNKDDVKIDSQFLLDNLIPLIAPWVALLFISLISCLCYCCCGCCDCCPPSQCCRHKKPYKGKQLQWPGIVSGICVAVVFVTSIVGLAKAQNIEVGFNQMICSVSWFVDDLLYGYTNEEDSKADWVGVATFVLRLPNLLQKIVDEFNSGLDNAFAPAKIDFINIDPVAIYNIDGLISTQTTNQVYLNLLPPSLDGSSYAFQTMQLPPFGPSTNSLSTIGIQSTGVKTVIELTKNTILAAKDESVSWGSTFNDINDMVTDALDSIQSIESNMNDLQTNIQKNSQDWQQYTSIVTQALSGLHALILTFSVVGSVGLIFLFACKKRGMRILLHINWFLFSILMMLGFLIISIAFPASTILLQFCNVFSEIIHTEQGFTSYPAIIDTQNAQSLKKCWTFESCIDGTQSCNGDGDFIQDKIDSEQLNKITSVTDNLRKLSNDLNDKSSQIVDLQALNTNFIDPTKTIVQDVRTRHKRSTFEQIPGLTNFMAQITTELSNLGCTNEQWVVEDADCPTGYPLITTTQYLGSNACVSINKWSTLMGGDPTKISMRYGPTTCQDCTAPLSCSNLKTLLGQLKSWVDEKNSLCDNIITQLNSQQTSVTHFSDSTQTFNDGLAQFLSSTADVIDLTVNKENPDSVFQGVNCLFLQKEVDRFYDGMCVGLVVPFSEIVQILIVISIFMFIGSFFLCLTAMRNARVDQEDNHVKDKVQPVRDEFDDMSRINDKSGVANSSTAPMY